MTHNLDAPAFLGIAVAMLKDKTRRFPARSELNHIRHISIVIPGQDDYLTMLTQLRKQGLSRAERGTIMDQIANDNQPTRSVIPQ